MEYLRNLWCCCCCKKTCIKMYKSNIQIYPLGKNFQADIEYILENFTVKNFEIDQTFNNCKNFIINSGVINEIEIKLSPVHKSDNWENIDEWMDGVYIVVGHITKKNICKTRYLLYIEDNNIELVERKAINKLVKSKNIII